MSEDWRDALTVPVQAVTPRQPTAAEARAIMGWPQVGADGWDPLGRALPDQTAAAGMISLREWQRRANRGEPADVRVQYYRRPRTAAPAWLPMGWARVRSPLPWRAFAGDAVRWAIRWWRRRQMARAWSARLVATAQQDCVAREE